MTIVAARRFGQRIIVLSDTMISDVNARANNIFPGRLKSIVVNKALTVSYAGLSLQALDAIRAIHRDPNASVHSTIEFLTATSKQFDGELEFLLCAHEQSATFMKISGGKTFEGTDFYWIGNAQAVNELSQIEVQQAKVEKLPDHICEEEIHFTNRFQTYLRDSRCAGVGGPVVNCLCSEYGHCYQNHANAFSWDKILIGQDDYDQRQKANKTGMYHFEYNVYSSEERGRAIVGLFLGQSNVGFIYDPLRRDEAEKVLGMSHEQFAKFIMSYGKQALESGTKCGHA